MLSVAGPSVPRTEDDDGACSAVLSVQRSQHDPRWARFEAEACGELAGQPETPLAWAGFLRGWAAAAVRWAISAEIPHGR